jgi:hypothetical protein
MYICACIYMCVCVCLYVWSITCCLLYFHPLHSLLHHHQTLVRNDKGQRPSDIASQPIGDKSWGASYSETLHNVATVNGSIAAAPGNSNSSREISRRRIINYGTKCVLSLCVYFFFFLLAFFFIFFLLFFFFKYHFREAGLHGGVLVSTRPNGAMKWF